MRGQSLIFSHHPDMASHNSHMGIQFFIFLHDSDVRVCFELASHVLLQEPLVLEQVLEDAVRDSPIRIPSHHANMMRTIVPHYSDMMTPHYSYMMGSLITSHHPYMMIPIPPHDSYMMISIPPHDSHMMGPISHDSNMMITISSHHPNMMITLTSHHPDMMRPISHNSNMMITLTSHNSHMMQPIIPFGSSCTLGSILSAKNVSIVIYKHYLIIIFITLPFSHKRIFF